jgi:hypothetical protein
VCVVRGNEVGPGRTSGERGPEGLGPFPFLINNVPDAE